MMNEFQRYVAQGHKGHYPMIDGCLPERAGKGAIWVYGIEPGHSLNDQQTPTDAQSGYLVERQLKWPFNRGAFRLMALLSGCQQENYKEFASHAHMFEDESHSSYVKANLYPVAARNIETWTKENMVLTS